jgi:hypothetical protein
MRVCVRACSIVYWIVFPKLRLSTQNDAFLGIAKIPWTNFVDLGPSTKIVQCGSLEGRQRQPIQRDRSSKSQIKSFAGSHDLCTHIYTYAQIQAQASLLCLVRTGECASGMPFLCLLSCVLCSRHCGSRMVNSRRL